MGWGQGTGRGGTATGEAGCMNPAAAPESFTYMYTFPLADFGFSQSWEQDEAIDAIPLFV